MALSRLLLPALFSAIAASTAYPQAASGTLPAVTAQIPAQTLPTGTVQQIDLSAVFGLPSVTGTVVQFATVVGAVNAELFSRNAPLTTANFLSYVTAGAYNNTIINRSAPGFVIQGGTYTIAQPNNLSVIQPKAAVQNEFGLSNTRGTIAMAKIGGNPNSATDTWFFNLADNSANLDSQNGGFTVFARVIGTGMTVIDQIAAYPAYDLSSKLNADFTSTPLMNVDVAVGVVYGNWIRIPTVAVIPVYPPDNKTTAVLSFSATSSNPSAVAVVANGSNLTVSALQAGSATVTVTATDSNGNQAATTFGVSALAVSAPALAISPASLNVAPGSSAVFNVAATGFPAPTYQWTFNGASIQGATSARYVVQSAGLPNVGAYACTVSNSAGSVTTPPAALTVTTPPVPSRLVNLSMLSNITGSLSMGFVTGGAGTSGSQNLLIRAVGPSVGPGTAFNTPGVIFDPTLKVVQQTNSAVVASNSGWGVSTANSNAVTAADNATGAFALTNTSSLDSALVAALPSVGGGYAAQVKGASGDNGFALTEVYDATPAGTTTAATPRLINLSCLTSIATGGALNLGFVIGGTTAKTVLIRASGPSIAVAPFNVPGTMADPKLVVTPLSSSTTVLASNSSWGGDASLSSAATSVAAFAFTSASSKDSATLVTLAPNIPYAVTVNSASGGGGAVLVEIYEVP